MKWTCPSDKLDQARSILDAAFTPAPEEALLQAIYVLRMMTRGRDSETRDVDAGELMAHAWARQLAGYPADVAISCLQDWPKRSPYWPTWHELSECLEAGVSQRRVMLHVVGQLQREAGSQTKRLNALPESDERRAQVVEDCLRKLAEGMTLGPFDSARPRGEQVRGRHPDAGTDAKVRREAEVTLEQMANERPSYRLSPMALKAFGIQPPAPPPEEEEPPWHTEEPE